MKSQVGYTSDKNDLIIWQMKNEIFSTEYFRFVSNVCAGGRSDILAKAKPSGCWCEQAPSEDEETSQHHFTSAG